MSKSIPRISIVTPSFNQGEFLEETILSVLSQDYPNLEYIIIDGGSYDNSHEIIRKYQDKLAYWVSEPDKGQYDAINKGFALSTGEIMAWINSDDKYTPWSFQLVGEIFRELPELEWLTTLCPLIWDKFGVPVSCKFKGGYTRNGFMRGENLPDQSIQQESVFWRRSLWERAGGYVDASYQLASDFELWTRFYQYVNLYTIKVPLGGFRFHGDQKSLIYYDQYLEEAKSILIKYGGRPAGKIESLLRLILKTYIILPYQIRRMMVGLKLKDSHNLCVYSLKTNTWEIEKI
jgi:glycosyltransferase involved in cell wall biosynthesis